MSKLKLKLSGAKANLKARQDEATWSVLIVDDEPANLDGLEAVLDPFYHVYRAISGQLALEILEKHCVDLIITDQRMPGMLGTEFLQKAKERKENSTDHLNILLTGYTDTEDLISCVNDGLLYRYLVKPWYPDELLSTVSQALDKIKIERQLKVQTEQLRIEVQQRRQAQQELEIALSELNEAQESLIAQEKLRALGEMVSGVAHDFGNLLTPVLSYSEELINELSTEHPCLSQNEIMSNLEGIRDAAEDGAALIKRLRASYTAHSSSVEQRKHIHVNTLVKSAIKLALPRWPIGLEPPKVVIKVDDDLFVFAVMSELRQAVVNLIRNALDAMGESARHQPDKELSLTIVAQQKATHMLLEIIDRGAGMSPGVLAQCQQAYFSTKGETGTGLGLAMVRRAIEGFQGTLSISSELGVGTTVSIKLPSIMM